MPIKLVIGSPFPKPSVLHVCSFVRHSAATALLPVASRMYVRMLSGSVFAECWSPCPGFLSVRGLNRAY